MTRPIAWPLLILLLLGFAACGGSDGGAVITFPETPDATEPGQPPDDDETPADGETPDDRETPEPDGGETPADDEPTPTPEEWGDILPCNDILVPLDKQHALPDDCEPGDLVLLPESALWVADQYMRAEAADALLVMLDAARAEGVDLFVVSAYRSYQTQVDTFNFHVGNLGEAEAERISARPGHSEHQLGTTADVSSESAGFALETFFGDTPEGQWVRDNSWRYGFIISYPEGAEDITGYSYEPWHLRYVGTEVAADVRDSGLTLREYLLR